MEELRKIHRVLSKKIPDAPHEVWLVLDGTNGQNAIQQAKLFTEVVEVTGLIVSKLDGTARGGAVFGITRELGLPLRYIGTGEAKELLEVFDPEAFVDAIVGRTPEARRRAGARDEGRERRNREGRVELAPAAPAGRPVGLGRVRGAWWTIPSPA